MSKSRRRTVQVLTILAVLVACALCTSVANAATLTLETDAHIFNTEDNFSPNGLYTFDVHVANTAQPGTDDLVVTVQLPHMVHFDAAASDSRCTGAAQHASCTIDPLGSGGTDDLVIGVRADRPGGGPFTATLDVEPGGTDVNDSPESATGTTGLTLYAFAELHATSALETSGPLVGGSIATLATTISNVGYPTTAYVYIELPAGLTVASYPAGCTKGYTSSGINCMSEEIPDGGQRVVRVPLTVSSQAAGTNQTITTMVDVAGEAILETDDTDNQTQTSVSIPAHADLGLNAEVELGAAGRAAAATYTLRVVNSGPSTSPSAQVNFALPAGMSFSGGDGCGASAGGLRCAFPSIASGGSATRTFTTAIAYDGRSFTHTVTFTLSGALLDPVTSNNTSSATVSAVGATGRFVPVATQGPDSFIASTGGSKLAGGAGNDVLMGLFGNDVLNGGPGRDRLFGGRGHDRLTGGPDADSLFGDAGNDKLDGGAGADIASGGEGNDVVRGAAGNDRLFGDAGNDVIVAGLGRDVVYGGDGNDTINVRDGKPGDRVTCGSGVDRVLADRGDRVSASCER